MQGTGRAFQSFRHALSLTCLVSSFWRGSLLLGLPALCLQIRYLGGSNALTRDIACAKYIEKHRHNEQHWMELAEAIAQDRGSDLLTDDVPSHLESWSSEESMTHRGEYVSYLKTQYFHYAVVQLCWLIN